MTKPKIRYIRLVVDIYGIVQAVGFRPTLHKLASEASLGGWVQNRMDRVQLSLDGSETAVDKFIKDLPQGIPSLARIDRLEEIRREEIRPEQVSQVFNIEESVAGEQAEVAIPADLSMCRDCEKEVFTPSDRRYGYPFTTCTLCGPRYTVINEMPYDRERTTLSEFPLCDECLKEYENPQDRRFHAESTACPVCGPQLVFEENKNQKTGRQAIKQVRKRLSEGAIVAVRGIGGYLLAINAYNKDAIKELRKRKNRPGKPFAVMASDIQALTKICELTQSEINLLQSPQTPIVILKLLEQTNSILPMDMITPDADTLGAMLPTSPLHELLFKPLEGDDVPGFEYLIMTSGNQSGEPICISNSEAQTRLLGIADAFLMHNREINLRNDDSLCIVKNGRPQIWRRARGYAPEPVRLEAKLERNVLAMGPELKNTIAVGRRNQVILSPHIGDLDTPEAIEGMEQAVKYLPTFLQCIPECIAVDLHPDMHSTRLGRKLSEKWNVPIVPVQHHHAHAVSCMAEHNCTEALALVFDGTGLGSDGTIWGAELLHVQGVNYQRRATFGASPLPGGDAAVRQPVRQLVGRLHLSGSGEIYDKVKKLNVSEQQISNWIKQIDLELNSPMCHSAGRLFDSFSAALGISPHEISYDGQPAIRLEAMANKIQENCRLPVIPYSTRTEEGFLTIGWDQAFQQIFETEIDIDQKPAWALAVHVAIAKAACEMVIHSATFTDCRQVVLSGGVFMNQILSDLIKKQLTEMGYNVMEHFIVPPNDGGVSLGQAVIAGLKS